MREHGPGNRNAACDVLSEPSDWVYWTVVIAAVTLVTTFGSTSPLPLLVAAPQPRGELLADGVPCAKGAAVA